jgi:nitroimidazol reductase NimA-like FMN-containing flavoprotein (pyridoxamine 5'-phosphate oxidase superfamily)
MKLRRDARALFDLDEFLSRPLMAHLATRAEDGARDTPLWYLWENGALWFIVEEGYNTYQHRVLAHPDVAVGFVDFDPAAGRLQHVGVRGRATVVPWDHARASRLLRRYYRHLNGYREPPVASDEKTTGRHPMVFVRVEPESVVLREQSYRELVLGQTKE